MTVKEIYGALDQAAPFSLAMGFDNVGLLVGDENANVSGILAALDITLPVIEEAKERGVNLIVSHHPVIFSPLRRITPESPAYWLVKYGISAICAHTNLDIANGGVNDVLCQILSLEEVTVAPPENLMRIGCLSRGMTPPEFAYYVKSRLDVPALRYTDGGRPIHRVAVCGGSCGDLLKEAVALGCEGLFTGEIKHSDRLYAAQMGLSVVDAGHFSSENVVIPRLLSILREEVKESPFIVEEARSNICPETVV